MLHRRFFGTGREAGICNILPTVRLGRGRGIISLCLGGAANMFDHLTVLDFYNRRALSIAGRFRRPILTNVTGSGCFIGGQDVMVDEHAEDGTQCAIELSGSHSSTVADLLSSGAQKKNSDLGEWSYREW
jgi:hypothetical protein